MRIEVAKNKRRIIFFYNKQKNIELHPLWLRERISNTKYLDRATGQRLYDPAKLNQKLKIKKALIKNQMAAKELFVAKFYISTQKWIPAINRLKKIVTEYDQTIFIEEALHRLVEIYYLLGFKEEAQKYAAILGYNYNSSKWFERSYVILNKDYKIKKFSSAKKENSFIKNARKNFLMYLNQSPFLKRTLIRAGLGK